MLSMPTRHLYIDLMPGHITHLTLSKDFRCLNKRRLGVLLDARGGGGITTCILFFACTCIDKSFHYSSTPVDQSAVTHFMA